MSVIVILHSLAACFNVNGRETVISSDTRSSYFRETLRSPSFLFWFPASKTYKRPTSKLPYYMVRFILQKKLNCRSVFIKQLSDVTIQVTWWHNRRVVGSNPTL